MAEYIWVIYQELNNIIEVIKFLFALNYFLFKNFLVQQFL